MKSSEFETGDVVFVRLPYEGGSGWAEVLDKDSRPGRFDRKTYRIKIRFLPGQNRSTLLREQNVALASIIRKQ